MNIGTRYTRKHTVRRERDYEEVNAPIAGADYNIQTALIGKPLEDKKLHLFKGDTLAYFAACALAIGAVIVKVSS